MEETSPEKKRVKFANVHQEHIFEKGSAPCSDHKNAFDFGAELNDEGFSKLKRKGEEKKILKRYLCSHRKHGCAFEAKNLDELQKHLPM